LVGDRLRNEIGIHQIRLELQLGQRVRLVLLARRGVDAVDQGVRVGAGCHCCWGWCCGARLGQRWVIAI